MPMDPALEPVLLLVAAFAILTAVLGLLVSLRRRAIGASLGDGDDPVLLRRIRAHGNLVEYAPLAVLLTWGLATVGLPPAAVWTAALLLLLARLIHAAGMLRAGGPALRALAMVIQHGTFLVAAGLILARLA